MIATFSTVTKEWKVCGKLRMARYGHGVIVSDFTGHGFLIVGGKSNHYNEYCKLEGDSMFCQAFRPELVDYEGYPEMMSVPHDYCPK